MLKRDGYMIPRQRLGEREKANMKTNTNRQKLKSNIFIFLYFSKRDICEYFLWFCGKKTFYKNSKVSFCSSIQC